ncbi:MAG: glycosyltransferase family 39 protein [Oscillospiraceae bacterium]
MKKALEKISKLDHKTMIVMIFALFIISGTFRSVFACYPKALQTFPDEIRYIDIWRSISNGVGIKVHNIHMNFDQILYPLLLVPFSFIKNQVLQITAVSIFNSFLMSSVIFPVYLFGKKVFKNNSIILLLAVTVITLPDLSMTMTFMTENLFFPLSAWLIYFVYRFWDSDTERDKMLYCILSAVFCFLAYLTKVVSVYFMGAFVLALGFDCLFTKKNTLRQNIKYGIMFGIIVCSAFIAFKLILYFMLGTGYATYDGNRRLSVYDFNTLMYFIYALAFNVTCALIAFFFFPVVVPLFRFNKLNKIERNMLVFAVSSLVIMIFIITLSISANEDYPKLYIRQHTRYYAPLLIIFLTLFFKELFLQRDIQNNDKPLSVTILTAFTVFFCMAVFGVFRFFSNVCIDGVLLQGLSAIGEKIAKITGDVNTFKASWQLVLVKSFTVLLVTAFTILLLKEKTRKTGMRIFVVLIFSVCIVNNFFAMKEFRRIYGKDSELIEQAISLNQYISENGGNVLIITDGYNPVLETYITEPVYWTKKADALKLIENSGYIDLTEQKIVSNYPWVEYDLSTVDYIITDNRVKFNKVLDKEINIEGVSKYSIYLNKDTSKIYLK